jgi:trk system potassium uptake protein TrkA
VAHARFAIIGLGRFGMKLARNLAASGAEVIAIDRNRQLVEEIQDEVTVAVRLDATDEAALRSQGIADVPVAVVGIGEDFESSALATSVLKAIGVPRVITRAQSEPRGRILRRIGADEIVYPEGESAERWATRLSMPRLEKLLELSGDDALAQVRAPKSFVGQTPQSLELRQRHGVTLVSIRRASESDPSEIISTVPQADTQIRSGDELIVVGCKDAIRGLFSSSK